MNGAPMGLWMQVVNQPKAVASEELYRSIGMRRGVAASMTGDELVRLM